MRDPDNIRAVNSLGVSFIGLIFYRKSSRFVPMTNPPLHEPTNAKLVGVFVDEPPQVISANVNHFNLDYVQLHGDESPEYIDDLRSAINPDIGIIKAISVSSPEDIAKAEKYQGHADMLLFDTKCTSKGGSGVQFDWSALNAYNGSLPFLLSGGIGPDDADRVAAFHHSQCVGIDLNSKFEIEPALKDVEKIKTFISEIKNSNC